MLLATDIPKRQTANKNITIGKRRFLKCPKLYFRNE